MFAQRRNHLVMHFSEHIPIVKRRISVLGKRFYSVRILHEKHVLYCLLYYLVIGFILLGYYMIHGSLNVMTLCVKQVTYC